MFAIDEICRIQEENAQIAIFFMISVETLVILLRNFVTHGSCGSGVAVKNAKCMKLTLPRVDDEV